MHHDPLIFVHQQIFHLELPQLKKFPIKLLGLHFQTVRHLFSPEKSIPQISHCNKVYLSPEPNPLPQRCPPEANKALIPNVDFNLVQYFIANRFSIKEQKKYNGEYTHYTEIFPLETQIGKTNIFYIHS
jgi:hypothetical protein